MNIVCFVMALLTPLIADSSRDMASFQALLHYMLPMHRDDGYFYDRCDTL